MKKIYRVFMIIIPIFILFMLIDSFFLSPSTAEAEPEFDHKNMVMSEVTDEQIIGVSSTYSAFMTSTHQIGKKNNIRGKYSEFNVDLYEFSAKKVSGIMTLSATHVKDSALTLNIDSDLNEGEMKIVVIRDNEILEYVSVGESVQLQYDVSGEHTYCVKMIAKDANMSVSVSRTVS